MLPRELGGVEDVDGVRFWGRKLDPNKFEKLLIVREH